MSSFPPSSGTFTFHGAQPTARPSKARYKLKNVTVGGQIQCQIVLSKDGKDEPISKPFSFPQDPVDSRKMRENVTKFIHRQNLILRLQAPAS